MSTFLGKFGESLVQRICLFVYIGMNNVELGLWSNHRLGTLTGIFF